MVENFQYRPDMRVVSSARALIRALSEVYGTDQGMALWDFIRNGLGEQIASDIFLGMLIGTSDLTIESIGLRKIEAIKEVRSFTGKGLVEAKDLVEAVQNHRPQRIDVSSYSHDQIDAFCDAMRKLGCIVI